MRMPSGLGRSRADTRLVLHHFVDELRPVLAEPGQRIVEVVHREHDAQVAQRVHRGVPVIRDHRRREKARELGIAMMRTPDGHGRIEPAR
jgi:hypothetical protein